MAGARWFWQAPAPFSGGTTINAGTLQIGNGGTTGTLSGNVTNNGILAFNRSDNFSYNDVISGPGAFIQVGRRPYSV